MTSASRGLTRVFFAYPSSPRLRAETIAAAANKIGLSGEVVPITWEDLRDGGKLIIGDVLQAIDSSAVSVYEITVLLT